ncbi:MAG: hemerythrin family protein [Methylococcales bacterium]|nr:hemerythrin family protein [Methylococcales bacterium]MDD5754479.1 hemerythrin family protein [Methylococcales bacterium]
MTIKWDNRFSVDHIAIDAEHKLLLTTINAIGVALRHPEDKATLVFFFDQLHEFALSHFKHEERLQLKHKFPFIENNAKGHDHLISDLNRIRDDVHRITKNTTLSVTDITDLHNHTAYLAKDWLLEHLLQEDLKMKGFMGDGDE